ncbi:MAG: hypothetical protein K6B52_09030 [Clostridiales bacterium]|nr:hypothetical protein [Clostridiales bacterium]
MNKKVISVILSVSIIFSCFALPAFANEDVSDKKMQTVYSVLDKVVNKLVGGIAALILSPDWTKKSDYKTPDSFLSGNSSNEFLDEADENSSWSLGYSDASLLTGEEIGSNGDYYVGGSLTVDKKLATEQWDDQRVRTVAISDGRGITLFTVIDCYGMANTDVRAIREQFLSQYKGSKEITSINISALHQHSCVDTFGMNGDLVSAVFTTSLKRLFGKEVPGGQNKKYMQHLYSSAIDTMNSAVENMKTGSLYFGKVDVSSFIRDKRDPIVFDPYLNRFRFVPDDGSRQTWFVEGAIHCVGNGAGHRELTGDYPLYMQRYIDKNYDANFIYIQGAELAISDTDKTATESYAGDVRQYRDRNIDNWKKEESFNENTADIRAYGELLAQKLGSINERSENKLDPVFNIAFRECFVPIDNNILVLAAKGGLLVNNVVRTGLFKYEIVTEVGYAEFGSDTDGIAVAIIPGELAPEIAFGGTEKVLNNWTGEKWEYEPFKDVVKDRYLLVFGIANDQIGYLLSNNNWHSFFTENEEIVSTGKYAGATIASAWIELSKTVNK